MGQSRSRRPVQAEFPSPVINVERVRGLKGSLCITGRYHMGVDVSEDYVVEEKVLGTGTNGLVLLATRGSSQYAVKSFRRAGMRPEERRSLRTEVEIFLRLDHPNVARLEDVYETHEELHLVMEYMSGGELFDRLGKRIRYGEADAAQTAKQMLLAVAYLHLHGVVHRDLKLENFLYVAPESDDLKLIDFGFAKFWDCEASSTMKRSCGTLYYIAPEVLARSYTEKADMWSIGIIVYTLLTGGPPFLPATEKEILQQIRGGNLHICRGFGTLSSSARHFAMSLLEVDPQRRLGAADALRHPWLCSITGPNPGSALDGSVLTNLRRFAHASRFRRACLSLMAWHMTCEDQQQLREQFEALDADRSGTISRHEFARVLQDNFSIDQIEAEILFRGLDASGEDEICYSEFLAAALTDRVRLHERMVRETFERLDVDGSGVISLNDLRNVLGDTYEGCDVEAMLREAEATVEGKLRYQEFLTYLLEEVPTRDFEIRFQRGDSEEASCWTLTTAAGTCESTCEQLPVGSTTSGSTKGSTTESGLTPSSSGSRPRQLLPLPRENRDGSPRSEEGSPRCSSGKSPRCIGDASTCSGRASRRSSSRNADSSRRFARSWSDRGFRWARCFQRNRLSSPVR